MYYVEAVELFVKFHEEQVCAVGGGGAHVEIAHEYYVVPKWDGVEVVD